MNFPRNSQLHHQLIHQEGVQEGKRQQISSIHASVLAEHSIAIGRLEGSLVGRTDYFLPEALDFGKIVPVLQLVVLLLEKPVERPALLVPQMAHKLFGYFVLQKVLGRFDQFGLQEVVERFVSLAIQKVLEQFVPLVFQKALEKRSPLVFQKVSCLLLS